MSNTTETKTADFCVIT